MWRDWARLWQGVLVNMEKGDLLGLYWFGLLNAESRKPENWKSENWKSDGGGVCWSRVSREEGWQTKVISLGLYYFGLLNAKCWKSEASKLKVWKLKVWSLKVWWLKVWKLRVWRWRGVLVKREEGGGLADQGDLVRIVLGVARTLHSPTCKLLHTIQHDANLTITITITDSTITSIPPCQSNRLQK